jgi:hypothetical protein
MMHPLVYDWNRVGNKPNLELALLDEVLRDGLQFPSVRHPTIEQKLQILHLIDTLGIDTANIGLPGAGPQFVQGTEQLAREIADRRHKSRRTVLLGRCLPTSSRSPRSLSASDPDRVLYLHWLQPNPAVRRGLDTRWFGASDGKSGFLRGSGRITCHARDRGHDESRPRNTPPPLHSRHPQRRFPAVYHRHCGACDAGWSGGGGSFCC